MTLDVAVEHHFACFYERRDDARDSKRLVHTHCHNSYLIWCTVSRRVDEVIPSDHEGDPMVWPHPRDIYFYI